MGIARWVGGATGGFETAHTAIRRREAEPPGTEIPERYVRGVFVGHFWHRAHFLNREFPRVVRENTPRPTGGRCYPAARTFSHPEGGTVPAFPVLGRVNDLGCCLVKY